MPNILNQVSHTPILEVFNWPRPTTRKGWFAITKRIVQDTIADMNLDPAAEAEVIKGFTVAGCCEVSLTPHCIRSSAHLLGTVAAESIAERPLYQNSSPIWPV